MEAMRRHPSYQGSLPDAGGHTDAVVLRLAR